LRRRHRCSRALRSVASSARVCTTSGARSFA